MNKQSKETNRHKQTDRPGQDRQDKAEQGPNPNKNKTKEQHTLLYYIMLCSISSYFILQTLYNIMQRIEQPNTQADT